MKQHIILLSVLAFLLFWTGCDRAPQPLDATFLHLKKRLETENGFSGMFRQHEASADSALKNMREIGEIALPDDIITIPVVVHVVRINDKPALSNEQIEQQILRLSRDFRRQNKDEIERLPEVFRNLAADTRIQFALAKADVELKPTSGILIKTSDRKEPFTFNPLEQDPFKRDPVKYAESGGSDAWPTDRFLNIWVCPLAPELGVGYASLHGDFEGRFAEDGIVISADYFAAGPAGRDKGRTLTNLAGKWLGLSDIWGTEIDKGSDRIEDTPPQSGPNFGSPEYPRHCRPESPYGDMFVNFMDATDDATRVMFTAGQADRMYLGLRQLRPAANFGSPMYFLPKGGPPASADYVIRDFAADSGAEPSSPPVGTEIYRSPDIVINSTAGTMTHGAVNSGASVFVNVRIYNYGNNSPIAGRTVRLYVQKASVISDIPPTGWTLIGSSSFNHSGPAGNDIVSFAWTVPSVSDAAPHADKHYCLVAVISNETCAPSSPKTACNSNLWVYTENNNNVGWRNVDIIGSKSKQKVSGVRFGNIWEKPSVARLDFFTPAGQVSIFDYGQVVVSNRRLLELWERGGRQGEGVTQRDTQLVFTKEGAFVANLETSPGEINPLDLRFEPRADLPGYREIYGLNVQQSDKQNGLNYQPSGGQVFTLKAEHSDEKPEPPKPPRPWWWAIVAALALLLGGWGVVQWRKKAAH